jgi:hypothetical protein
MESSRTQELALVRIRLVADIAMTAQCSKDEFGIVVDMISDMADLALSASSSEPESANLWSEEE